ncbi:MAG: CxxC-x17-CxxC domain-containing protein [Candidatus Omnitrophota bacterium]
MKNFFKDNSSSGSSEIQPDILTLVNKMRQQLVSLEKKVDILINQSSERASQAKYSSKPLGLLSHSSHHGKGRQDNISRERNFVKATCAECNKECEVPFRPSGDRPVYCRECFSKHKGGGLVKGKRDNNRSKEGSFVKKRYFDKPYAAGKLRDSQRKKPSSRRTKGRA